MSHATALLKDLKQQMHKVLEDREAELNYAKKREETKKRIPNDRNIKNNYWKSKQDHGDKDKINQKSHGHQVEFMHEH